MCIWRKLSSVVHDFLGEGRREEQDLDALGQHARMFVSKQSLAEVCRYRLLSYSHTLVTQSLLVQHVVGFVQY